MPTSLWEPLCRARPWLIPIKKPQAPDGCAAARLSEFASYLAMGAPIPWLEATKPPVPKIRPLSLSYAIRCVSLFSRNS